MRNRTKTIIAGMAACAAVPALGIAVTTTASAAADTPDDHWECNWGGCVMWNDYDSQWHDKDYDNIWVEDEWGDGNSIRLQVYRNGDLVATTHAYNGDVAKVSFGNVPNGESVYWRACIWDNGEPEDWCFSGTFYE